MYRKAEDFDLEGAIKLLHDLRKVGEEMFGNSSGREIRKCSSGKRRFLDKVSCEARIELNGKTGKIFAYHCPECDQWHMTSKEQK